jgi:hypothetical protein
VEVARVDRISEPGREDQAAVAPHVTGREPSPGLLDPMPLECLHRDLRQRQRRIRRRRLRVSPQQRPVDPLDLPRDERLASLEVDVLPGQPEHLPAPQPEREQQDVPGVHRVAILSRRLQELPSLIDGPHGIRFDRGIGTRTSAATLRKTSSSRIAWVSAPRSTRHAWWTVQSEATSWQQAPNAQHCGSGRAASLPWKQHWQRTRSVFTHTWTSRTISLSSLRSPRSGTM